MTPCARWRCRISSLPGWPSCMPADMSPVSTEAPPRPSAIWRHSQRERRRTPSGSRTGTASSRSSVTRTCRTCCGPITSGCTSIGAGIPRATGASRSRSTTASSMRPSQAPAASARLLRHHSRCPPLSRARQRAPSARRTASSRAAGRTPHSPPPTAVTLTPTVLNAAHQGFAAGSYVVQLTAQPAAGGAPITRFGSPVILHFGPLAPVSFPPTRSTARSGRPSYGRPWTVPAGGNARFAQAQDGSIDVATVVPGSFGLLRDVAPAFPPVGLGQARSRSTAAALGSRHRTTAVPLPGYRVTFGGKPVLTLAGTARRATIETFHARDTECVSRCRCRLRGE